MLTLIYEKNYRKSKEFLNITGEILSQPLEISNSRNNNFAMATGDFQWIHVNDNKAKNESHLKLQSHTGITPYL